MHALSKCKYTFEVKKNIKTTFNKFLIYYQNGLGWGKTNPFKRHLWSCCNTCCYRLVKDEHGGLLL